MDLVPLRIEVSGSAPTVVRYGDGVRRLGPLETTVAWDEASGLRWSLRNRSDAPVRVRALDAVFRLASVRSPLRMFRHGYQSWSRSGTAVFGRDRDPSCEPGAFEFVQAMHHADQRPARDGELRSELVTVLDDEARSPLVLGFEGGSRHDGTFRLRPTAGDPELWVEAFFGDALLPPGAERGLHAVVRLHGGSAAELLEAWAGRTGLAEDARAAAPFLAGWCSWYRYFSDVTEATVREELAACDGWPLDVFQVDDGYQRVIGDWLEPGARFPSGVERLARDVAAAGLTPGIWLAPFLAAPESTVAVRHPEWLAGAADADVPLVGMFNPTWSSARGGLVWTLDTTRPEVLAHLEELGRGLRACGFRFLKLDFTMAPSFDGRWSDPTRTPAERVRAGYEAVRRGAGEDAFILGCGAPLAHVVGVVDANRIGPDVAPTWDVAPGAPPLGAYDGGQPALRNAVRDTLARSFLHRRLWTNDPDCLLIGGAGRNLTAAQREGWARVVGVLGGLTILSDRLRDLGRGARALVDDVLAMARAADGAARAGRPARCDDLLEPPVPTRLASASGTVTVDPDTGAAAFVRARARTG